MAINKRDVRKNVSSRLHGYGFRTLYARFKEARRYSYLKAGNLRTFLFIALKGPATAGGLIHGGQTNTFGLFGFTEIANFDLRQMEFFLSGAFFHNG